MKGIILAGGYGTRLYPITKVISKQMIPIYDKPMIYYPLSVLMLAGIREILIISTPRDVPMFQNLLGDGSQLGLDLQYMVQTKPRGLAEAFILGESFIEDDRVALVLGDNVFHGQSFSSYLKEAAESDKNVIFGYPVRNPQDYGVAELNADGSIHSLVEKPKEPHSNLAIPGLYFYNSDVVDVAKTVEPSARGELEITSINEVYLERGELELIRLGRGMAWLDTGTVSNLHEAAAYVAYIQSRQGLYVSCIEEIAWRRGFISLEQLEKMGKEMEATEYGQYLLYLVRTARDVRFN